MTYELVFIEDSEQLFINEGDGQIRQRPLPLFGITNSFLQAAKIHECFSENPLQDKNIIGIHRLFTTAYRSILGDKVEKYNYSYLPFIHTTSIWADINNAENIRKIPVSYYMAEFTSLYLAVSSWLAPAKKDKKKVTPLEHFCENETASEINECDAYILYGQELETKYDCTYFMEITLNDLADFYSNLAALDSPDAIESYIKHKYMYDVFSRRALEVSISKRLVKYEDKLVAADFYSSNNLQALAWIEIMYALDHELYAGFCAECGKVFHLRRPYTALTCSLQCYSRNYRKVFKDSEGIYSDGERGFKNKMSENRRKLRLRQNQ